MNLSTLVLGLCVASPQQGEAPAAAHQSGASGAADVRWIADFDEAVKVAKDEGKDLLVDFTGSDWCIWCIRLHDEVFVKSEFTDAAPKSYVLVALDFPQDEAVKAKVPNPTRNDELKKKYGVRGFPTVLLIEPDGDVYGRTGYQKGGAPGYVQHLSELSASGKKELAGIEEHARAFDAAQGEAKLKLLDESIERLQKLPAESAFGPKIAEVVRAALTLDADNAQGRKRKAVDVLLERTMVDQSVIAAVHQLDPKNEQGLIEKLLLQRCQVVSSLEEMPELLKAIDEFATAGSYHDKKLVSGLFLNAAFWNYKHLRDPKDPERDARSLQSAKKFAQIATDLGVEDPRAAKMLDEILGS